jgi:hypothetical protein
MVQNTWKKRKRCKWDMPQGQMDVDEEDIEDIDPVETDTEDPKFEDIRNFKKKEIVELQVETEAGKKKVIAHLRIVDNQVKPPKNTPSCPCPQGYKLVTVDRVSTYTHTYIQRL